MLLFKGRVGGGALTKAFGAIERRLAEVFVVCCLF